MDQDLEDSGGGGHRQTETLTVFGVDNSPPSVGGSRHVGTIT